MEKGQDPALQPSRPRSLPNRYPTPQGMRADRGGTAPRLPAAGPGLSAHLPAAALIHYLRNPVSRARSSGKLSLIKRVKPRGRGLAGNRLQRAGGAGTGSTSLSAWGWATEGEPRVLGRTGDATHWRELWTGHIPTRGTVRNACYECPSEATVTPGPGAVSGRPGAASLAASRFTSSRQCRASVSPPLNGLSPSAQRARRARGGRGGGPGQGGCRPGCAFGLNPGVPPGADMSKNNRPEHGANRRLFIARHP